MKTPVTVVVSMRNSASTILETLKSLVKQEYPIQKIIIIDNISTDGSVRVVEGFAKKTKRIPIKIIRHSINIGVGGSFNEGAKLANSTFVVFMHSDSMLPTTKELTLLVKPLINDTDAVASYSHILLPEKIWLQFNFWEKCLLARAVDKDVPGLNGKFDCVKKDVFLSLGGFDETHYGHDMFIGGEDGDLHIRLAKAGKVVCSTAGVIHLHYLSNDYRFTDWIMNRKLLARSYGRLIRMQGLQLPHTALIFGVKPILALLPFIPAITLWGIGLLFLYSFVYMNKMYRNRVTLTDPRILLLPLITVFLVYYETFWMIESFMFFEKSKV